MKINRNKSNPEIAINFNRISKVMKIFALQISFMAFVIKVFLFLKIA